MSITSFAKTRAFHETFQEGCRVKCFGSNRCGRGLARDTRGAMMIAGLFMALFMTATLYYLIGISEVLRYRTSLQDAADSAAFSSAVLHARGMNLLVLCNLITLSVVTLKVSMRMISAITLSMTIGLIAMGGAKNLGDETPLVDPEAISWSKSVAAALSDEANRLEGVDAHGNFTSSSGAMEELMQNLNRSTERLAEIMPGAAQSRAQGIAQTRASLVSTSFVNPIAAFLPVRRPPATNAGMVGIPDGLADFCTRVGYTARRFTGETTDDILNNFGVSPGADVRGRMWNEISSWLDGNGFDQNAMAWFCGSPPGFPPAGTQPQIPVPYTFQLPEDSRGNGAKCDDAIQRFLQRASAAGRTIGEDELNELYADTTTGCPEHNQIINDVRTASTGGGFFVEDNGRLSHDNGDVRQSVDAIASYGGEIRCPPYNDNSATGTYSAYQWVEGEVRVRERFDQHCQVVAHYEAGVAIYESGESAQGGDWKFTDSSDGNKEYEVRCGTWTKVYLGRGGYSVNGSERGATVVGPLDRAPCEGLGSISGSTNLNAFTTPNGNLSAVCLDTNAYLGSELPEWSAAGSGMEPSHSNDYGFDRDLSSGIPLFPLRSITRHRERQSRGFRTVLGIVGCAKKRSDIQVNIPGRPLVRLAQCMDCPFEMDWLDQEMHMGDPRFQLRAYTRAHDSVIDRLINFERIVSITAATGAFGVTQEQTVQRAQIQDITERMRAASVFSFAQGEFLYQSPAAPGAWDVPGSAFSPAKPALDRSEWGWHMYWTGRLTVSSRDDDETYSETRGDVRQQCRQIHDCAQMRNALDNGSIPATNDRVAH